MIESSYFYHMLHRPYGPGTAPEGVVRVHGGLPMEGRNGRKSFDILEYARPLTLAEVRKFELIPYDSPLQGLYDAVASYGVEGVIALARAVGSEEG